MPGLSLAAAVLLAAVSARAATTFAPQVLQCDGTYAAGSNTRHPAPQVRVEMSDPVGLKVGRDRLGIVPGSTRALWRFDSGVTITHECFAGCGGTCRKFNYEYADPNGTQVTGLGHCVYNATTCADTLGLNGGLSRVPVSLGACPIAPPATGATSPFGASTLDAARFNNMGTFNGAQMSISSGPTIDWDLPPTYTLTAWIRTSAGGNQRVLSAQSGSQFWGFGLSGAALRHFDSRDVGLTDTAQGSGLNDGNWHLIHVVRRNGNDRRFYIDGRFINSVVATSTNSFSLHPLSASGTIGGFSGGGEHFTGNLDEVRVLISALSDDDVALEFNATSHKYSSNGGVSFSTVAGSYTPSTPATRSQGPFTYVPGEAWTANSRWIYLAQSTFSVSAIASTLVVSRDTSAPSPPQGFAGTPTTTTDATWSWSAPASFCPPPGSGAVTYTLVDPATGLDVNPPGPLAHPTVSVGENFAGGPNQLRTRSIKTTDVWGTSVLSPAATVYTLAAVPTAISFTAISSGSFTVSWNANGNPTYTRYEVTYSADNFATPWSTAATIGAAHTATSIGIGGLSLGTTYFVRVRAFSGRSSDFFGGTGTAFLSGGLVTRPTAPNLSATALSNSSVRYDWTSVPGATSYTLYGAGGSPVLYTGPALTFTSTTISVNTSVGAEVEANTPSGPGLRSSAFIFTRANAPTVPTTPAIHSTSITFAWSANGNPGYTFYELNVSTDAAFAVVIATIPTTGTQATAVNLLPGTNYFARVRAISGSQETTSFLSYGSVATTVNAGITQNTTGGTPYASGTGLVGMWHFDESSPGVSPDLSSNGNAALLTCLTASCTSTPTYAAGPPGLGTALASSGLSHGLGRVPDAAAFNFAGNVTVVAWAYPTTTAQPNGAGVVVRGDGGAESWALEVSASRFRFMAKPGFIATATTTLPANAWTHLVGSYDTGTGLASLYVNGQLSNAVAVTPPRNNIAHDISIGNRQSAAASYDRGFIGRVDAVRLFSRAYTAAEALAEYNGNFVSTVSASAPNNRVQVGLPPAAFGAPAVIYVSANPAAAPIRITPAALDAGINAPPDGLTLVANSVVEIVPVVGGLPFTATLGSSATVSIAYDDSNGDSLIDGSSPPLPVGALRMHTLNTTVNRWEELPTTLDPSNKRAVGLTPHFSVFALFAPATVGTSLNGVRAYPVPWKPGSGGKFDGPGIVFDRLPAAGTISILTGSGEAVADLSFSGSSAGRQVWNGTNGSGRRVASGVYYARVRSAIDDATALLKLAIER